MKNKIACLLIVVCFLLTQISCESISTIDLPENPPRLVLNCLTKNDTPFVVELTHSNGLLGSLRFEVVSNATIDISENGTVIETLHNTTDFEGRYYFKNARPKPGNIYTVHVSVPDYKSVSSSFSQPLPVTPDSLSITILGPGSGEENTVDLQGRIYFNDPPGPTYYSISITQNADDTPLNCCSKPINLLFQNPSFEKETIARNEYGVPTLIFDDSQLAGLNRYLDFRGIILTYPEDPVMNFYTVTLRVLTPEYYMYYKEASLQQQTRSDPFAQPVLVSSNVDGGFGIFAGFTQTERTWEIK